MAWESYLSKLCYSKRMELCDILDHRNKWKQLASDLRFNQNRINRLEMALQRRDGSPTDELLSEYGHLNPTLKDLHTKLQKLKLLDAAKVIEDYVEAENCNESPAANNRDHYDLRLDSDHSDSSQSSTSSEHHRQCEKFPAPSCTLTTQHSERDRSNINHSQTSTTKVFTYDRSNFNHSQTATTGWQKSIPQENLRFDIPGNDTTNMFLNNQTIHGRIYADNDVTAVQTNTGMLTNNTFVDTYSGMSSSLAAENPQRSTDYTNIHFNSLSSPPPAYTGTSYNRDSYNKFGTQHYSSGNNHPADNFSNKLMYPQIRSEVVTESSLLRVTTNIHVYPYEEIKKSTYGFDEEYLYGQGCFGEVYEAKLANTTFAIKRFLLDNPNKESLKMKYMRSEVEKLQKYHHKNILTLSGYSNDGPELCFVFKFMHNGSLEDHLHGTHRRVTVLSVMQRYNILIGAANGLQYLHNLDKPVIHGDIKSANVLIDENFEAKISDIGQASIATGSSEYGNYMHVNPGHIQYVLDRSKPYLPPESEDVLKISMKGDTFSFGIVICECCTGEKPRDGKREGGVLLKDYINNNCGMKYSHIDDDSKAGLHKRLCDRKITQEKWPFKAWYDVFLIGRECISEQRPLLQKVLQKLQAAYNNIEPHIRKPDDHVRNDGHYANAISQHPKYPSSDTYAHQSLQHSATAFNAAYEEPIQLPVIKTNKTETILKCYNESNNTEQKLAALAISDNAMNQCLDCETEGIENKSFPSFIKSLSLSESERSGETYTSMSDDESLPAKAVQDHFGHENILLEPSVFRYHEETVHNKRLPSFAGGSINSSCSGASNQSDCSSNGERFNLESYNYTEDSSAIEKAWPNFVNDSRMGNSDSKDSRHGKKAISLDAEAVRNCDKYSLYNSKLMDEQKCYSDPGPAVWKNKSFINFFQKSTLSGPQAPCVSTGTKPIYQQVDFQL